MENNEELIYPPLNFSWIVKNELAAMAWPQSIANLQFLEKQGIKHLVTLSPEKRPPIHSFPNLKWTEIAIKEFRPPSISQIRKFIDVCERCKIKNEVSKCTFKIFSFIIIRHRIFRFLLIVCPNSLSGTIIYCILYACYYNNEIV